LLATEHSSHNRINTPLIPVKAYAALHQEFHIGGKRCVEQFDLAAKRRRAVHSITIFAIPAQIRLLRFL